MFADFKSSQPLVIKMSAISTLYIRQYYSTPEQSYFHIPFYDDAIQTECHPGCCMCSKPDEHTTENPKQQPILLAMPRPIMTTMILNGSINGCRRREQHTKKYLKSHFASATHNIKL